MCEDGQWSVVHHQHTFTLLRKLDAQVGAGCGLPCTAFLIDNGKNCGVQRITSVCIWVFCSNKKTRYACIVVAARNPKQKWREFQNNGICSKYTKSGPGRSAPGPLSYVLSSIPSRCAAALAIVMCASIPTASKPSSAAAASVVPLPANGSRILPPGTHICTT